MGGGGGQTYQGPISTETLMGAPSSGGGELGTSPGGWGMLQQAQDAGLLKQIGGAFNGLGNLGGAPQQAPQAAPQISQQLQSPGGMLQGTDILKMAMAMQALRDKRKVPDANPLVRLD